MENIVDGIKKQIGAMVTDAIRQAVQDKSFPDLEIPGVTIEIPREKGHGEFAANIAMQITKKVGKPPRVVAQEIIDRLQLAESYVDHVECAGPGFINFHLRPEWRYDALKLITEKQENYGKISYGKGKKVMVEFVSANPTGPLHMGNARGGALGDCIAAVLAHAGYDVTREFYVNDAGNQMEIFGRSLEARFLQKIQGEEAVDFPEDGYFGEDIKANAEEYIAQHGTELLDKPSDQRQAVLASYALEKNLESIKQGLEYYGIHFDIWFREKSLYESGAIQDTLQYLKENGYTIEKDGALWLSAEATGLEKDEVLVRANGLCTYFAADIAYHKNKFLDRGYDWVINLWGADHHGHVARMKAAVHAFGINPDQLDVVLFQLVRLYRNGEVARMSKRTGKSISLMDLLDEVGRDAARFFFNMKTAGSHLDFDLDLAVSQSNENPVFYVQYAHARICSMLSLLEKEGYQIPAAEDTEFTLLQAKEELELISKLAELPEEIKIAAISLEPSRLTRYLQEVAALFHSFYNACRIKGESRQLAEARMFLVMSTKIVIGNVLRLLSIAAPERM